MPPNPITIQFKSPTAPMLERLDPMASSMGFKKTPSVKSVPMDSVMMAKAAASTTQP